ncbi:putative LITAF domain containing protein [Dioscorea sansibarensis]
MEMKGKVEEPALGVPYPYATAPPAQTYYVAENPYQAGMVPPNAIYGDPKGIPLQQTMYRDTPAPFNCTFCGSSGLTTVRSKPSVAAVVGCMMTFMVGFCFLCPSMDCLWHKYHYCPNCGEKVADFEKSDPCLVVDVPRWTEPSFAVPA